MTAGTRRARRQESRGFPTKTAERRDRMRRRVQLAPTAEAQLSAAFDWFRSEASRADSKAALMRDAAQYLADRAAEIEGHSQ